MNPEEVDQKVRTSLRVHAEDAPSGAGTLDAVRDRARRIQTRQRAGMAGVAVLAAVAVVIGTPYALSLARHTGGNRVDGVGHPGTQVTTATTTTPPVAPQHASRVALAAPTFTPITFPLNPTFTPAGLPTPTEGRTVGEVRLIYSVSPTSVKGIYAAVDDSKPSPQFPPKTTKKITVSGHPATLYTGTVEGKSAVQIIWKLHTKWVFVEVGDLSVADVERYANGLTESPRTPTPLPFTIALAPIGYQVDFQEIHPEYSPTEFYFSLTSPGQLNNQLSHDMLGVVSTADTASQATGTPIQVGGYPAKINTDSDGIVTIYVLRPGFVYEVHEFEDGPLSQADLIRFAAGIGPQ